MDEKEFGKLTGEQVEQFSPFVKTMFEEFDQLRVELSSNEISPNRLDEIASPWSMWYSLSMVELLSLWAWSFRFDKIIRRIAKSVRNSMTTAPSISRANSRTKSAVSCHRRGLMHKVPFLTIRAW